MNVVLFNIINVKTCEDVWRFFTLSRKNYCTNLDETSILVYTCQSLDFYIMDTRLGTIIE